MDDTITIPRSEYERLLDIAEDVADMRAIDDFKKRLAAGEEEFLPSDFIDRMLEGENIIKLWREHRGMTQTELSRGSGVHRVALSKIETGKVRPTVATLSKLARSLGVSVDDLI